MHTLTILTSSLHHGSAWVEGRGWGEGTREVVVRSFCGERGQDSGWVITGKGKHSKDGKGCWGKGRGILRGKGRWCWCWWVGSGWVEVRE